MSILSLDGQWKLTGDGIDIPATVPGCVQLDLISSHLLDDPTLNVSEKDAYWIEDKAWTYTKQFTLSNQIIASTHVELVAQGIDTISQINFNGKLFHTNNMFREYVFDIKSLIKYTNTIAVSIESPIKYSIDRMNKCSHTFPVQYSDDRTRCQVFIRKAPYNFGWDWGSRIVTSGIWKSMYIRAYSTAIISSVCINTIEISKESSTMELVLDVIGSVEKLSIILQIGELTITYPLQLHYSKYKFALPTPILWWPNGYGEPHLYRYNVKLMDNNGSMLDTKEDTFGVRFTELINKSDDGSFYFKINGIPIFIKGANYIPSDSYPTRTNYNKYEQIIKNACSAHFNALRVWGGGIYESNDFYVLCDKYGLLVWQDFMFACAMYPCDIEFMENIKQEAICNIKRIRSHPCVIHWCGNNEVWEAYNSWINFKEFETENKDLLKAYNKIFNECLPNIVKELDPYRSYTHSSPLFLGNNIGDQHYWDVWHRGKSFSAYTADKGRFFSEYGFQAYPSIKTLNEAFNSKPALSYMDIRLTNRQKATNGENKIKQYLKSELQICEDSYPIEDYIYKTQILQAIGIGNAIRSHRCMKPYTMGTMYWQLNDCWPVISWSSMDYYCRFKALHYVVKKSYNPILCNIIESNDELSVYAVNDSKSTEKASYQLEFYKRNGESVYLKDSNIEMPCEKAEKIDKIINTNISEKDAVVVIATLSSTKGQSSSIWFKNPLFFSPDLKWDKKEAMIVKNTIVICISATECVRHVVLDVNDCDGEWDDNMIDLIVHKEKTLVFTPSKALSKKHLVTIRYYLPSGEGKFRLIAV
jgi:beta-mannosidase